MENKPILIIYPEYNEKLHGYIEERPLVNEDNAIGYVVFVTDEPIWKKLSKENETLKRLANDQSKGISDLVELKGHLIAEIALNKAIISKYREQNVEHQNELLQEKNKKFRTIVNNYETGTKEVQEDIEDLRKDNVNHRKIIEYYERKINSLFQRNDNKNKYISILEELIDKYKPEGLAELSLDVINSENDVEYFHKKLTEALFKKYQEK